LLLWLSCSLKPMTTTMRLSYFEIRWLSSLHGHWLYVLFVLLYSLKAHFFENYDTLAVVYSTLIWIFRFFRVLFRILPHFLVLTTRHKNRQCTKHSFHFCSLTPDFCTRSYTAESNLNSKAINQILISYYEI